MHPVLRQQAHRPWPVPDRKWRWRQVWTHLAFVHWEIPPAALAPHLPDGLEIDLFDGTAWIGLVPFDSKSFTQRPLPPLPDAVHLPELNVRTYVTIGGKPGVWFLSLDIPGSLAVFGARSYFFLPYFRARMEAREEKGAVHFCSEREETSDRRQFEAVYQPVSGSALPPDPFDQWATERYCLYSADTHGHLHRAEIHHQPWSLAPAEIEIRINTYLDGLETGAQHPRVLFAQRQETLIWPPRKLSNETI